jgi:hypothetical protein
MQNKLVIIQCVKKKVWNDDRSCDACIESENAYVSLYFKKMKEHVLKIIKPKKWLIFSAEFGLITPDYKVCAYNTTYLDSKTNPLPKAEMERRISSQIINIGSGKEEFKKVGEVNNGKEEKINYSEYDEIVILAGKKYIEKIMEPLLKLNKNVITPFQDNKLGGIGYINGWLKEQIEKYG